MELIKELQNFGSQFLLPRQQHFVGQLTIDFSFLRDRKELLLDLLVSDHAV